MHSGLLSTVYYRGWGKQNGQERKWTENSRNYRFFLKNTSYAQSVCCDKLSTVHCTEVRKKHECGIPHNWGLFCSRSLTIVNHICHIDMHRDTETQRHTHTHTHTHTHVCLTRVTKASCCFNGVQYLCTCLICQGTEVVIIWKEIRRSVHLVIISLLDSMKTSNSVQQLKRRKV